MMTKRLALLGCLAILGVTPGMAQGEAALPFLLLSPDAVSNGMGDASVALYRDDPLAPIANPAHLGMFSRTNYFSAGLDNADWLPAFGNQDLYLRTFGFNGGVNLATLLGIGTELSVGLGYSKTRFNIGTFNVTGPDGPEVIASFEAWETSDNFSIGVGWHSWVSISGGFTYKDVKSNLLPANFQGLGNASPLVVPTNDIGVLLHVPVFGIVDRLRDAPLTLPAGLAPVLNLSAGVARNNNGEKMVVYIPDNPPDPLPRYARAGIGVELGVAMETAGLPWSPFLFSWTRESNDVLVIRHEPPRDSNGVPIGDPPPPEYQEGLGDIDFANDVILGKPAPEVVLKTGWQIRLLEVVTFRGGIFREHPEHGNRNYTTTGYTISLGGAVKMLRVLKVKIDPETFLGSVLTRLDIRYSRSEYDTSDPNHPLDDTRFSSWALVFSE